MSVISPSSWKEKREIRVKHSTQDITKENSTRKQKEKRKLKEGDKNNNVTKNGLENKEVIENFK